MGMENLIMESLSRCNKRTERHGPPNQVSYTAVRAEYGYLVNFEAFDHNGTVFAPKQFWYQKVAMGMENIKM